MSGPSVTVVGSLNMDLVVVAERRPEAGETVLGRAFQTSPGGKGANQAVQAARLGASVSMVGQVGDDAFGSALVAVLAEAGVDVSLVRSLPGVATGVASIVCTPDGENSIVVAPGANGAWSGTDVPAFGPADVVLLQLEVPVDVVAAAAARARAVGALVALNAAPALACGVRPDVLVVNESEALALAVTAASADVVVVTRGAAGSVAYVDGGREVVVSAFAVETVDTTGAGDAFCAALAVGLAERRPVEEALRRASAAGALATTRPGAQDALPTAAQLDALLATARPPERRG
jgi:ribokinase